MKDKFFEIILIAALIMGVYACWPKADPTIADWQRYLNSKGYPCVVDGKLTIKGNGETEMAWNDYIRDRSK